MADTVMTSVQQVDLTPDAYTAFQSASRTAWDIETSGLDPHRDRIATVQIYAEGVGSVIVKVGERRPERICRLLQDAVIHKLFHHAMFDLRFMVAHWRVSPVNIGCTKIAAKLLDRRPGGDYHSLRGLLMSYLGVQIDKGQQTSDWMAHELSPEQIAYAANDVQFLLPLMHLMERRLAAEKLASTYDSCVNFVPTRVLLELGGWDDVFSY